MKNPQNCLCLILVLLLFIMPWHAVAEEEMLSDKELTDLLYEMSLEDDDAESFLVLPESYQYPVTGVEGVYSLLLIGVDTDGKGITGRSDTMVMAVFNAREHTLKMISFMRDLYVRIPRHGQNRLNAAFVYGGPEALMETIRTQFGLQADGYLAVDFGIMARLVDAVGGVSMTISDAEMQSLNGILSYYHQTHELPGDAGLLNQAGFVHLNGMQAMAYARIRKIDSDFERVGRQQALLGEIFRVVAQLEPSTLGILLTEYASQIKTNVSMRAALELAALLLNAEDTHVTSLTIPVKGGYRNVTRNNSAFLVPNLKKNNAAIAEFLVGAQ